MKEVNNPSMGENQKNHHSLSEQQQAEIQFLNEEININFIGDNESAYKTSPDQYVDFLEQYKGVDQVETFANDEEKRNLIELFDPESLVDLQVIGIKILEFLDNETLVLLSSLIPVKVRIQPPGLSQPLILLIESHLVDDGGIYLKCVPYAKHIPPIPLTNKQREAVNNTHPFFMFKRVSDAVQSPLFEHKQNELWDTLTLTVSIKKKQFEDLMEVIKFQPLQVEKWAQNQFWTEDQLEKLMRIVDLNFPLQLGHFTGLHCLFYPLNHLFRFPHLQAYIQKKLLEFS